MLYTNDDRRRVKAEVEPEGSTGRSAFRRDFGRLLHSPAFRRLQGKTQLFPGHESDFFRNRLTHSLEVAQVAKGIALLLNASEPAFAADPIDTDLVELAALAHDLGHPPFGHNGERALDDCMKPYGGFEGNAQTLWLLSCVEKKVFADAEEGDDDAAFCGISKSGKDRRLGLNLTYRSLASVLKYDRPIPAKRKKEAPLAKGYYASQAGLVKRIKEHVGTPPGRASGFKTVECQIMDVADDIAYSTYDLEDAMKGGFSHPLAIRAKLADKELVERVHAKVRREVPDSSPREVFEALDALFDLESASGEPDSLAPLLPFTESTLVAGHGHLRVGFTSNLLDKFVRGVRVEVKNGRTLRFSRVYLERAAHLEIEALKHLNYELMIMSPRLKVVEYRGYDLVSTIFRALDSDGGHLLLPEDYRVMHSRLRSKRDRRRLICDFVAGMTDRYAVEFYSRLRESGASIFKPI